MRRLNLLMLVCFGLCAVTGLATQTCQLQAYDASTGQPLRDVTVKRYVVHLPEGFWQGRRTEWLSPINAKDETCELTFEEGMRGGVIVSSGGYYTSKCTLTELLASKEPLRIFLTPKIAPISLIALRHWRHRQEDILMVDTRRYFDCLKADWLPPHGEGGTADIEFSLHRYTEDGESFDLFQVRFLNEHDGFMRINHPYANGMFIREAPADFQTTNALSYRVAHEQPISFPQENYVFRVRTQLGPSGGVTSAYYGKLYDAFYFNILEEGWMCDFEFYLNPTVNDRNLEFNGEALNESQSRGERVNFIR